MLSIDTQKTMAQFTERLKEELVAEELCRQANMTDVDTIDDLVELYRPRSQGDMSDSSGRDGTSLVPLADDTLAQGAQDLAGGCANLRCSRVSARTHLEVRERRRRSVYVGTGSLRCQPAGDQRAYSM